MKPRSSLLLAGLALAACGGHVDYGYPHPRGVPRTSSTTGTVTAAEGGTLAVDVVELEVPPDAVPRDLALTLHVNVWYAAGVGIAIHLSFAPEGVVFTAPATLRVDLSDVLPLATSEYSAASGAAALAAEEVDGALVVTLHEAAAVYVGPDTCASACDEGTRCRANVCVPECASDADCPDATGCGRWLDHVVTERFRCDAALGACVDDGRVVTPCATACDIETGACHPPGACPPPQRAWPGERGLCLCGFPELVCPDGGETLPDVPCDTSADCADLEGCDGLPTCLRPGTRYPDECFIQGFLGCFYYPPDRVGSCAPLCEVAPR